MSRLINADALIIDLMDRGIDHLQTEDWNEIQQTVAEAPTVDAVPVVHGEWIPFEGEMGVEAFGYKEYTTLGFRCSVCHADIDVSEQYFRYCPICGSKMDGERKGGDG